ncbi:DUF4190 domain-containing protein [Amycolatopsis sp., V23-08]|uniref:DUF4190 domain-containing protein n=1 Tax=Amycolatopsis heterodermiae TaxID=3110235 RepID=A0ABU5RHM5_9PSEU|nr:DUF4190 domain-containing protein [Amycolatopsis sp., V23-08]MEA5365771.1 DUF4190 domain-containing protein [Amycolatopsis sp., V23-08]
MTDPSGDKDKPSTSYDPPSTTELSSYDPASYEPPATADPTFDSPVPDSTAADTTVADTTTAPDSAPAASADPGLPPGAYETPAAHIPGTPYAAPGYPQPSYPQPYVQQPYPPAYGAPYAPPAPYARPPYGPPPRTQDNALAIGALVCSILGFCSGITAIAGLVMGHIALSRTNRGEGGGRGIATGAVIVGYVVIALWIGFFTTFVILGVNGQFDS